MWPDPEDGPFPPDSRRPRPCADPDARLALVVAGVLGGDNRTRHVTVEVQNRVVLLSGEVDTRQSADVAVALARGVTGVRDVCDGLRVNEPVATGEQRRFDDIVAGLASGPPPQRDGMPLPRVIPLVSYFGGRPRWSRGAEHGPVHLPWLRRPG